MTSQRQFSLKVFVNMENNCQHLKEHSYFGLLYFFPDLRRDLKYHRQKSCLQPWLDVYVHVCAVDYFFLAKITFSGHILSLYGDCCKDLQNFAFVLFQNTFFNRSNLVQTKICHLTYWTEKPQHKLEFYRLLAVCGVAFVWTNPEKETSLSSLSFQFVSYSELMHTAGPER